MTGAAEQASRVRFTQCWECLFDFHHDPPREHPWANDEDRAHATATGLPAPAGVCGCWCARGTAT